MLCEPHFDCLCVHVLTGSSLPNWKVKANQSPASDSQTVSLKSFDLCQTAASHVSALATVYHENFNLSRSSPFLGAILLNVGVTHTVTCKSAIEPVRSGVLTPPPIL